MSTQTFWDNQQQVVENFYELLYTNFTEADRLIQDDENFEHVLTYNACYQLYQEHCKEQAEYDREQYLMVSQMHVWWTHMRLT